MRSGSERDCSSEGPTQWRRRREKTDISQDYPWIHQGMGMSREKEVERESKDKV
jgi:hypothetical protein